jgi:maltose alpha-D-glucosyltransferase/alpha-amylase
VSRAENTLLVGIGSLAAGFVARSPAWEVVQKMLSNDPLWYKDAIIYELHVRSFHDGVDDGFGDFRGLTEKLDYLKDLGITTVWLLPFYPSPLKDDGYDIADYAQVHPQFGKLEDFQKFLNEAHARGLRVITELVINHTPDQHSWFQRARRSPPGSVEGDFYVWSDTPAKYCKPSSRIERTQPATASWSHPRFIVWMCPLSPRQTSSLRA